MMSTNTDDLRIQNLRELVVPEALIAQLPAEGPLAKHDQANFAEGRQISALAFGCAAVISTGASGVARHGGQGCEKGEDGRRRNLRTK